MVSRHCIVVTCFSENQPGYMDFSYRLQALARHYRLTVLSQDPLTQPELQLLGAEYQAMGRRHGKLGWLGYLWQCASFIRHQGPDVVVLMHSSASPISLLIPGMPTWLYWNEHPTNLVHMPEGREPIGRLLAMACHALVFHGARHADIVMPIGEEHRDDLLLHRCRPERVSLNYMGVADDFSACAAHRSGDEGNLNLIYIGTVSAPRGRDVMLDGMAEAVRLGYAVHLTIVGADTEQLAYCHQRIEELGLAQHVRVLGRVLGMEIPALLAEADVGVCLWEDKPWWRFNPPTKLFEYLVAGLPVLASNIRTHTRYVQSWANGLIFDYSVDGFSRAIGELVSNRRLLAEMKRNALSDGERYLWSRIEPDFLAGVQCLVRA